MANAALAIDDKVKDCKSTRYYELVVNKDNIDKIGGRFYLKNGKLVNTTDYPPEIGQTIKMRSPLYCKCKSGLCPTCFGDLYKHLDSKYVGVIAGGDLNDIALNTYMKLRHKSSVPAIVQVDMIKDIASSKLNSDNDFKKDFIVDTNKITANCNCTVLIDHGDYDEAFLIESTEYFTVPGVLTISNTDTNKTYTLPLMYPVKLMIPNDFNRESKVLEFNYTPGDIIIAQEAYLKETDVRMIGKLLEGQVKYLNTPEELTNAFFKQINYGMDLSLVETIIGNMFRDNSDPTQPARLTDYKNYFIAGQKKLPSIQNWVTSLNFENVNKSLKFGLLSGADAPDDPISKIANEHYTNSDE